MADGHFFERAPRSVQPGKSTSAASEVKLHAQSLQRVLTEEQLEVVSARVLDHAHLEHPGVSEDADGQHDLSLGHQLGVASETESLALLLDLRRRQTISAQRF